MRNKRLGIKDILYFDIDKEFDESKIQELFHCDAIHLSGGDTAYFLSNIQKRKFAPLLKAYVEKGGVLIGLSAGSILMTETIDIIKIGREFDKEYNLQNMDGLGLVNFEFMPHWSNEIYSIEDFKAYTLHSGRILYLCRDEDGIVITNGITKFIGKVIKIEKGVNTMVKV